LRYVLGAGLLAGAAVWAVPRAQAAWQAHTLGGALADYALCMAGPSGAQALRDDPALFRTLIRRRLVASPPHEAPFARCVQKAREVTQSPQAERAHTLPARAFAEYGLPEQGSTTSLAALEAGPERLIALVQAAGPFVRGGYAALLRPSPSAKHAIHPLPPPRPSEGSGLEPARGRLETAWSVGRRVTVALGAGPTAESFHSHDGGVSFRRAALTEEARERAGNCSGDDDRRSFELGSGEDGSLFVTVSEATRPPRTELAVEGPHTLLAAACDARGLVLAARRDGAPTVDVTLCRTEGRCQPLKLPATPPFTPLVASDLDVARVAGTTVIAVAHAGIVRVISSRDDGRSWTPPTVAFDSGEDASRAFRDTVPVELLAIGSRLLLYGAARSPDAPYPLLVSTDHGASFRPLDHDASPSKAGALAREASAL